MTRDELEQIMVRGKNSPELWAQVPEHMTLTRRRWAKEAADALSAAGCAVVPLEATGEMIDAYYYANPGKLVRHLEDAIAAGNLLTKGDG